MLVVLFVLALVPVLSALPPVRLPEVPAVLHPPTPTGIQMTANEDDPEQRPGLFQGDIAIDPVSHSLWKVGLRWVLRCAYNSSLFG